MKTASPLRYPGGKAALAGLLREIRSLNDLGSMAVAEPFAGGAGAALSLLMAEECEEIYVNDADPAIFAFWWSITRKPEEFTDLVKSARISIREWKSQRAIYRDSSRMPRLRKGFSTFYLNRCNRSGIVKNGGPIGGLQQHGKWKLGARFNKLELCRRISRIGDYQTRIHISNRDGIDFIKSLNLESTFLFVDPPYFEKGPELYLNLLDANYHEQLAKALRERTDAAWVLTYDDCSEIRKLYAKWAAIRPFKLRYNASQRRHGHELLITPHHIQLPTHQDSGNILW